MESVEQRDEKFMRVGGNEPRHQKGSGRKHHHRQPDFYVGNQHEHDCTHNGHYAREKLRKAHQQTV